MVKGAILSFAFLLFLAGCSTRMSHPPPPSPAIVEPSFDLEEYLSGIPPEREVVEEGQKGEGQSEREEKQELTVKGLAEETGQIGTEVWRGEEEEPERMANHLLSMHRFSTVASEPRIPLPDLTLKEIFLKQKRRLFATLTNTGDAPFPMEYGELSLYLDGRLERRYALKSLTDHLHLHPNESLTLPIPFSLYGRKEVEVRLETSAEQRESNPENNVLKKILEGAQKGPDIVVQDLDLTEDLELVIYLANLGETDLRKGGTLRVRIYLDERKISDFEHFLADELKAQSKTPYVLRPPYRISIRGIARVKVSISPKSRMEDVRTENNVLERRFIIFPFQIGGREREQFSFFIPRSSSKEEEPARIKMEVRWEGAATPLKFSLEHLEDGGGHFDLSGRSPVKVEWPLPPGPVQRESRWRASLTNLDERRVEGHLIIQHP